MAQAAIGEGVLFDARPLAQDERLIRQLKPHRRVALRYEKRAADNLAMVTLRITTLLLT